MRNEIGGFVDLWWTVIIISRNGFPVTRYVLDTLHFLLRKTDQDQRPWPHPQDAGLHGGDSKRRLRGPQRVRPRRDGQSLKCSRLWPAAQPRRWSPTFRAPTAEVYHCHHTAAYLVNSDLSTDPSTHASLVMLKKTALGETQPQGRQAGWRGLLPSVVTKPPPPSKWARKYGNLFTVSQYIYYFPRFLMYIISFAQKKKNPQALVGRRCRYLFRVSIRHHPLRVVTSE